MPTECGLFFGFSPEACQYVSQLGRLCASLRSVRSGRWTGLSGDQFLGADMFALPWVAIMLAALATLSSASRWLALGQLAFAAAAPVALLLFAAHAVSPRRKPYLQCIGHALFIALAIALMMHWLPGFHNPRVIASQRFTADAVAFTMYLNLDKPLIGFWLLLVLPWTRPQHQLRTVIKAGVVGMLLTTAACLLVAVQLGIVTWEPKWPSVTWLWLLNNLLLVTFTEEALFRGYLQGGLSRLIEQRPYANAIAIFVAAGLFGLYHAAGGWQWIALGSIAGVGYGLAYRFGGLQAAVLAHFGLNVTHFFLFTYPMLEPTGKL
jgi:membrane protease YdiL (CAAX protease family)